MTFKEYLVARQRSYSMPVQDFRTYIITDPSVPDFTERAALETFLRSAPSLRVQIHNVIAGQAWSAYESALRRQARSLQNSKPPAA
jgi:hypothetical protein